MKSHHIIRLKVYIPEMLRRIINKILKHSDLYSLEIEKETEERHKTKERAKISKLFNKVMLESASKRMLKAMNVIE